MTVLEAYLDPIAACLTPEVARRIVDCRPDARVQGRLDYLRERANQGLLSDAERAEYAEFVDALDFMALLKGKVRSLHNVPSP